MVREGWQVVQSVLSVVLTRVVVVEGYVLKGIDVRRMDAGSWFELVEFVGSVQWSSIVGSKVGGGGLRCTQNLTEREEGSLQEQFVNVDDSGTRVF